MGAAGFKVQGLADLGAGIGFRREAALGFSCLLHIGLGFRV